MSVQTLYTAATGMEALQTKLDVVANNLANVNTIGFKRDRANFEDLMYRDDVLPGTLNGGQPSASGTAVGLGVRVSNVQSDFVQGAFQQTNRALDVAIAGEGFFQVNDPSTGETLYTRAGNFNINANGALVLGSASIGRLLEPQISIPPDATNIVVNPDGQVFTKEPGNAQLSSQGQIQIVRFINPEGLIKLGDNLYSESDASGAGTPGIPGQNGLGELQQNMLEASNVEPVQELIDLITTQRSFELNSQAVQAGDQVLQLISNLRRF